jgi:secretion/DNA translocation related TadE-like protein
MRRDIASDRGSVSIILVALLGVVVLLATGVADATTALDASERAQSAADAAALAAAEEIAVPAGRTPEDAAAEYAERNGVVLVDCACDPATLEAVVTVRAPVGRLWLFADDLVADGSARAVVVWP